MRRRAVIARASNEAAMHLSCTPRQLDERAKEYLRAAHQLGEAAPQGVCVFPAESTDLVGHCSRLDWPRGRRVDDPQP